MSWVSLVQRVLTERLGRMDSLAHQVLVVPRAFQENLESLALQVFQDNLVQLVKGDW